MCSCLPSQGHWDPDSLCAALNLGGQEQFGNVVCVTSLPSDRALLAGVLDNLHTIGPYALWMEAWLLGKGKAIAELRPVRRHSRLHQSIILFRLGR